MKKFIKYFVILLALAIIPVLLPAQAPPHPNGGNAPGSGNIPVGGAAPLGSGLLIMMMLGSLYATRKVYSFKNKV
jgi:hypothetical protein